MKIQKIIKRSPYGGFSIRTVGRQHCDYACREGTAGFFRSANLRLPKNQAVVTLTDRKVANHSVPIFMRKVRYGYIRYGRTESTRNYFPLQLMEVKRTLSIGETKRFWLTATYE